MTTYLRVFELTDILSVPRRGPGVPAGRGDAPQGNGAVPARPKIGKTSGAPPTLGVYTGRNAFSSPPGGQLLGRIVPVTQTGSCESAIRSTVRPRRLLPVASVRGLSPARSFFRISDINIPLAELNAQSYDLRPTWRDARAPGRGRRETAVSRGVPCGARTSPSGKIGASARSGHGWARLRERYA